MLCERVRSKFGYHLFLLLMFMGASLGSAAAEEARITFLHSNDMGEIGSKPGFGGFPELTTLIKAEKNRSPNAVLTFGGDLISPSLMSGLSHGVEMVDMLNALKMDVAVLGNHEFDFGPDVTRERVQQSKFPWLASNVQTVPGTKPLGTAGFFLKEVNGFKVGFMGLVTPETAILSSPGNSIVFEDVFSAAKKAVDHLTKEGAEIIVALTHMDLSDDLALAQNVAGIHVILGGHDHKAFATMEGDTVILQAGSDLRYLGVVDLLVEYKQRRGKEYLSLVPSWKILATTAVTPDNDVDELIMGYEKKLDQQLNVAVGQTEIPLDTRRITVRTQPAVFGQFIAKAMKMEVKADIGFTNGGGIRGDRQYDAGTILTRKDILKELPFGNVTVKLEVTGADVQAMVEHGVSKVEEGAGRFAQYDGLEYEYDVRQPAGARITELHVNGSPVDPDKIYTIATNDYVAGGGDGYGMLTDSKVLIDKSAGTLMATTVMNYIQANGGIKRHPLK